MSVLKVAISMLSEIPLGEGREFDLGGEKIAVFRMRNGRVFAVGALCPHRQGPLADGLTGGTTVVCPFHGRKFDLTTGQGPDGCAIATFDVEVDENGVIMLTLPEGEVEPVRR